MIDKLLIDWFPVGSMVLLTLVWAAMSGIGLLWLIDEWRKAL